MNSTLSTINSAFNVGSSVLNIFDHSATPLALSGFVFKDFEIPEKISGLGSKYHLTKHQLPGGKRGVDGMGAEDDSITWKAKFLSADASQRAIQLKKLCKAGNQLKLDFGAFHLNVVVEDLKLDYIRSTHIDYEITLCVISNQPPASLNGTSGLFGELGDSISSALQAPLAAVAEVMAPVTQALQAVQPVLGAVTGLFPGSSAAFGILGAVSQASAITGGIFNAVNGNIGALTSVIGLPGVDNFAQSLMSLSGSATDASGAFEIGSNLGVMGSNLQTPSPTETVPSIYNAYDGTAVTAKDQPSLYSAYDGQISQTPGDAADFERVAQQAAAVSLANANNPPPAPTLTQWITGDFTSGVPAGTPVIPQSALFHQTQVQ